MNSIRLLGAFFSVFNETNFLVDKIEQLIANKLIVFGIN